MSVNQEFAIPKLAVDIGGTIADNIREGYDKVVSDAVPYSRSFEVIYRLRARFDDRRYLVSRISEKNEQLSIAWLARRCFFPVTRIPINHLVYCRERSEKARICAELGITHFIDNRMEILKSLAGIVKCLILFCPDEEAAREEIERNEFDEPVIIVSSWEEIAELFGV